MSADLAASRQHFPLLAERNYAASQCLGPCPREAFEDLDAYRRTLSRRKRDLGAWIERYEAIHGGLERLFDAPPDSVFLSDSATAAQAALAACLEPRGASRRIVTSTADFHSSRYLWRAQERRGFEVVEVEANGPEHAEAETLLDAIDERTAVVALSLVSPRSGALLPARAIAERAREVGALVFLDAYQAAGIVPVSARELGAHVIVAGTHKWLSGAGTGLAFAYVEPSLAESLLPVYPGWTGHKSLLGFDDDFRPHPGARRFEQGTVAIEPVYTARAGLDFVLATGVSSLRERSLELTGRLIEGLRRRGLSLRTPLAPEQRGGMVCVDVPDPQGTVTALEEAGIDIDERPGAGVRIGPHPCQREDEIDALVEALGRIVERGGARKEER